jgi:hypothetical protein
VVIRKRLFLAFFTAWAVSFIAASILHTLQVQSELLNVGVDIAFTARLTQIFQDLLGLAPTYGVVIGVSLILGFLIIQPICKLLPILTPIKYPLAGSLAFATMLLAMQPILNITLIAGARGEGMLYQCVAGLIGGYVFGLLHKNPQRRLFS